MIDRSLPIGTIFPEMKPMSRNDTVTDLREIEKRLMEAAGGHQEIDALLWSLWDDRPLVNDVYKRDPNDRIAFDLPPKYTFSIDAAIALCERVLPGWRWLGDMDDDRSPLYAFRVKQRGERWDDARPCYAASPALALCLAIVRALIAKEQTP